MLKSVRARLTLWYAGALALALLAFALAAYLLVARFALQRADAELADAAQQFAATLQAESEEPDSQDQALEETMRQVRFRDRSFWLYDGTHRLLAASEAEQFCPEIATLEDGQYLTTGNRHRAFARQLNVAAWRFRLVVARPLTDHDELLQRLRRALGIAAPLILLGASLGGYYLAYQSLRPALAMGEAAARISATNLHERLPVAEAHDELGRLAQIFNGLLGRLEDSFRQQRRFLADASHELRTPLAIVCGEAEVTLAQQVRTEEEYREALTLIHDEGRRMTRIVEDLFLLARADAGRASVKDELFYLDELVNECARAVRTLAAQRQISLLCATAEELPFHGDELLLRRMLLNLLDNAIKYTPPGGSVKLGAARDGDSYVVTLADTGAGVPPEAQAHIFGRFYRADEARSRNSGTGAGLGLSIARWIAAAHNGSLELTRSDASGSIFTAIFPAQAEAGA